MSEEEKSVDISEEVLNSLYLGRGGIYFRFLSSCAKWLGPDDARTMYKELTLSGITLDHKTLNNLRQITAIAEISAPESVMRVRQALRNYFTHSEHGIALRQTGAIIIITGSIQYGDPLDYFRNTLEQMSYEQEHFQHTLKVRLSRRNGGISKSGYLAL